MYKLLFLLLLISCSSEQDKRNNYIAYKAYPSDDTSTYSSNIDITKSNTIINIVNDCLHDTFPNGEIEEGLWQEAQCYNNKIVYDNNYTIVIDSNWGMSCDGSQQVLSLKAPNSGCIAKGLEPTTECPCRWRSVLRTQGEQAIYITTPDMHMLSDVVVRHWTGCANPWASEKMAKCASPKL